MARITAAQPIMCSINLDVPFRLAFGELQSLPRVFYKVRLSDGTVGFGEASIDFPFSDYDMWDVFHVLQAVSIVGRDISEREDLLTDSDLRRKLLLHFPAAFAAFNMALDDAYGKSTGKSVLHMYDEPARAGGLAMRSISFQETREQTAEAARLAHAQGLLPKIKAGIGLERDIENLCMMESIGLSYAVDFNGAYNLQTARQVIEAVISRAGLRNALYIEQPTDSKHGVKSLAEIASVLQSNSGAIVVADESFLTLEDALACASAGVGLNFKIQKIGGLYVAKEIEEELLRANLQPRAMIGGTFPTAIGRAYDQQAACILQSAYLHSDGLLPSTDYFTGERHLIREEFKCQEGRMSPQIGFGLGINVDETKVERFVVTNPRHEYSLIRSNKPGERIAIRLKPGQSYRELYEQKSARTWDWNLGVNI